MTTHREHTILLVEDLPATALIVMKHLANFGYTARTVRTGEEAVRTAMEDPSIGLVLMDILLGSGIDGTEAARQILSHRQLPIVFLTSHPEQEIADRVRGITRYGYVLKDSAPHIFQSSIEMAFELFDLREKLRASEQRYLRIVEELTDYVYTVVIEHGRPVETVHSAACEAVTGYSAAEYAADPFLWLRMIKDEDRDDVTRRVEAVLAGSVVPPIEHRIVRKDGRVRWVSDSIILHHDAGGVLTSYDGIVRDITEQKNTERALLDSELRFRSIFEGHSSVMLLIEPASGRIVNANNAAAQFYGYTEEQLRAMSIQDINILSPEDNERERTMATSQNRNHFYFSHRCASGEIRKVEVHSSPIDINGGKLLFSIINDITERKRGEEALRISEAKLRAVLENTHDAIGVHIKGIWEMCNPAAVRLFGVSSENDLIGTSLLNVIATSERPRIAEFIRSRMAQQDAPAAYSTKGLRADGSVFDMDVTLSSFILEGKRHVLVILRDITERRQADELLRDMQRRESIGILSGGIAHDFNNLLGSMMGNISLAQGHLPGNHPAAKNLDRALAAIDRAAELTEQMLAYAGKGKFQLCPVDIGMVVQDHLSLFKVSLPKNVALSLHLPQSPVFVNGDPGQIKQVIMNLIFNGGEAIGEQQGTVTVTLTTVVPDSDELVRFGRITNSLLHPGTYALLEVKDNGTGMNRETMAKMFDPFFTTKFTGRGLGLSAVLGIIQGHDGGLTVDSTEGVGTIFKLLLPVIPPPPPVEDRIAGVRSPGSSHLRTILVIDDEVEVATMAQDILEAGNFTTIVELNPLLGIEAYKLHRADIGLVLLDLTMPEISGKEVVERLKVIDPDVKIVISSGYSIDEVTKKIGAGRVSGFIQKPYRMQALLSLVDDVLK